MKVLVVDDQITVLRRARDLLEKAGHRVVTTQDWRSANRLLHKERPDLAVVDEHLEDFQGSYLVKGLRVSLGASFPVVLMSAEDVEDKAWAAGASGFIKKDKLAQLPEFVLRLVRCPTRDKCRVSLQEIWLFCDGCVGPGPRLRGKQP